MNLEKYTQKSQKALLTAQHLAQDNQHQVVEPIHLLLALVQQQDGSVRAIIAKASVGTQAIEAELSRELDKRPKVQGVNRDVSMSRQTADVLSAAERYAKGMQDDYVEHILLGLADSAENKHLTQFGLTKDAILGRQQHVQVNAGARRTASDRRNHAGRIPQTYRERSRIGAPLPAGDGGRAVCGRYGQHFARIQGTLRSPSRRANHRCCCTGCRAAL
ncbi:MAG TPA: Clp protease N-terminal domain-containing protein [Anaerolineales bacterium]|nr:Clp protease N-terminal domain-containing protein [Anaerolineales bacterium]